MIILLSHTVNALHCYQFHTCRNCTFFHNSRRCLVPYFSNERRACSLAKQFLVPLILQMILPNFGLLILKNAVRLTSSGPVSLLWCSHRSKWLVMSHQLVAISSKIWSVKRCVDQRSRKFILGKLTSSFSANTVLISILL